mmetsp:Transcript_28568/g.39314  ORF Transcript_28568/g.39314 Transcript_28568/m.39314 type:complete len:165 (-) Transcript_28568:3-497(-)
MGLFQEVKYSSTVKEFRCIGDDSIISQRLQFAIFIELLVAVVRIILRVHSDHVYGVLTIIQLTGLTIIILFYRLSVIEESVTVIRGFGIQTKVKYFCGAERNLFLETDKIERVFIHEYIHGSQVKFSLAFLLAGDNRLTLAFNIIYPGFKNLQKIYMNCKQGFD